MRKPAEDTQSIVDRNNNDALISEPRAVIERLPARPSNQRAAVYPEEDWRVARVSGSPDIQRQAILAHRHRIASVDVRELRFGLQACGPELSRFSDAFPARHRTGRAPSRRADGRQHIWDALEDMQFAFDQSLYLAGRRVHNWAAFGIGWDAAVVFALGAI